VAKTIKGLTVTKRFRFEYAHYLPDYEGKCARLHGHSGVLEVEVSGPPIDKPLKDVYPTMVVDFGELKAIVNSLIIEHLDHHCLNDDFPNLHPPTAEKLVIWIVKRLQEFFEDRLVRVRVYETVDSYAEWRRG